MKKRHLTWEHICNCLGQSEFIHGFFTWDRDYYLDKFDDVDVNLLIVMDIFATEDLYVINVPYNMFRINIL